MPLRIAKWSDLLPAAHILARAFAEEDLLGVYMHPHQHQYPNDFHLYFLRSLREAFVDGPDSRIIVAYSSNGGCSGGLVQGIAVWQRKRAIHAKPLFRTLLLNAIGWYNYLEALLYPNRAADPKRADVMARTDPFIEHFWTGTRAETWYLNLLGVDLKEEGQGVGRALVKYGFELATEDHVGCSVISSLGKDGFYQKVGFDVVVGSQNEPGGHENPMKDIPGGTILFWDNGKSRAECTNDGRPAA